MGFDKDKTYCLVRTEKEDNVHFELKMMEFVKKGDIFKLSGPNEKNYKHNVWIALEDGSYINGKMGILSDLYYGNY